MWRRVSLGLTVVAVGIGLWGIVGWVNRPVPPPLGTISLQAVTPPNTSLTVWPQKYCDESVPGFWATGKSSLMADEVKNWYDKRYGAGNVEVEARLEYLREGDPAYTVYDEFHVFVRNEGAGSFVWVSTYDTTSHHCLRRSTEPWDLKNVSTFVDACEKLIIEFWGVEYGEGPVETPPADWQVMTFEDDRFLAHRLGDPGIVYAKAGAEPEWRRYVQGTVCRID